MLKDFDFVLPEELIAKYPLERGKSRLLYRSVNGQLSDMNFSQICDLFQPGDVLVLNNTKVIPSCLRGYIGNSELKINLINRVIDCEVERWEFLSKPRKKAVIGSVIRFSDRLVGIIIEKFNQNDLDVIEFFTIKDHDKENDINESNNGDVNSSTNRADESHVERLKTAVDRSEDRFLTQSLDDRNNYEENILRTFVTTKIEKLIEGLIDYSKRNTINTRDYLISFDSLEEAIESIYNRNYQSTVENLEKKSLYLNLQKLSQVGFFNLIDDLGEMPLPLYMKRSATDDDRDTYQTVFSQIEGSVAAPTAGLHFSCDLLEKIQSRGVKIAYVTLHIGGGTFLPVRVEDISQHKMHSEFYSIDSCACDAINNARLHNSRIIAVGTTVTRTLESAAEFCGDGKLVPHSRHTNIFIRDKYQFKIVDCLITNFHLPKSTLFMLICSFVGCTEFGQMLYRHAIDRKYRFFSYGDACFLER